MLRHRNEFPIEATLPEFDGATAWLNHAPVERQELRGRVVLVSFGTYTCINWIRSLPYVRAWADAYAEVGLVVVGVQTPEFDFEANLGFVRRSLEEMGVRYPVAVDNDYAIWQAFANHYWPALYFADAEGHIRHHHYGEGEYEASEMVLQMLLRESGHDIDHGLVDLTPEGVEAGADWADVRSPESYLGYDRSVGFASPGGVVADRSHVYAPTGALHRNDWALSMAWRVVAVPVLAEEPGATVSYQFHARDVHLVMGPPPGHPPVRFRVSLDGEPPRACAGLDIDADGNGRADYQRLYQLIRQSPPIRERRIDIEFLDAGLEAFVFTFG
jgi:hypothetical protein